MFRFLSSVCYMFFESFLCDVCHIVLLRVAPRVLGLVCFLLFSRLGTLASRVAACGVWSRVWYRVGCVCWL